MSTDGENIVDCSDDKDACVDSIGDGGVDSNGNDCDGDRADIDGDNSHNVADGSKNDGDSNEAHGGSNDEGRGAYDEGGHNTDGDVKDGERL